ncbi:uncharacterized protein LOC143082833 isoform X2 [Mytilus galloprovincialis]|uniref:uncharacterized protein LOC143082833 isoform X2 n=1 Tax=Mytilus galloprovincialis TaxID=29158 RepID=UPI003F7C5182
MNQYQKVYMNQIHSSSLLGQLAQMWKSQMLCDALIRTGNVTTKAHRVVLVAACPMLQSMDNASVGSHLEVRLAADIKQEAVNSFLQYLYEGFMMLSEENCKDVEKVARLLQVDSVTKCCIDFYNCLQKKTGVPVYSNTQYKYSSADLLEFRHVRTTDLQKTLHERMMKRAAADSVRPTSPSGKRQRMQQQRPPSPNIDLAMFGQKADDTLSMTHSYMGNTGNQAAGEPWERVPRIGAIHSQRPSHPKPGVIEIVEDSLEILQTQPPDKDGNKSAPPIIQKSLAISVSSQLNSSQDVHVVNVNDSSSHPTAAGDGPIMSTGRDSITVSPLTVMPGTSSLSSSSASSPLTKDPHKSTMDKDMLDKQTYAKKLQSSLDHQSSTPQRGLFPVSMSPANMSPINQVKKSFAAGSASQAASMSQSHDSPTKRTSTSAGNEMERPQSSDQGKDLGTKNKVDDRSASNSTDMAPDLSIVKVEPTGEAGLDMYVDVPEESMIQAQQREQREHDDESDLELEEASGDWSRDEMSNEAAGGDQNNSWYIGQFKDAQPLDEIPGAQPPDDIDAPNLVENFLGKSFEELAHGSMDTPEVKVEIVAEPLWYTLTDVPTQQEFNLAATQIVPVSKTKTQTMSKYKAALLKKKNRLTSDGFPSKITTSSLAVRKANFVGKTAISSEDKINDSYENPLGMIRPSIVGKLIPTKITSPSKSPKTITVIHKQIQSTRAKPLRSKISKSVRKPKDSAGRKLKYPLKSKSGVRKKPFVSKVRAAKERSLLAKKGPVILKEASVVISPLKSHNLQGTSVIDKELKEKTPKPRLDVQRANVNSTNKHRNFQIKKKSDGLDKSSNINSETELDTSDNTEEKLEIQWKRRKYFSGKKFNVCDPKFWSLPIHVIMCYDNVPQDLAVEDVSKQFGSVSIKANSLYIDHRTIKLAMDNCQSKQSLFTRHLFRHAFSIGEIFNRHVSGLGGKEKVNPDKLRMLREIVFHHFPLEDKEEEEEEWKQNLVRFQAVLTEARLHMRKWLKLEQILDKI